MTFQFWSIFVVASLPVHFAPGPNNLLALRNGSSDGILSAAISMLGRLPGYIIIFIAAGFGLAAVLNSFPGGFALLKLVGGLYLSWLGASTALRLSKIVGGSAEARPKQKLTMREEFLTAIANPKAVLFATAFYSQFLDAADAHYLAKYSSMVAVSLTLESIGGICFCFVGAMFAKSVRHETPLLWLAKGCGVLLCAIGLLLTAEGVRDFIA